MWCWYNEIVEEKWERVRESHRGCCTIQGWVEGVNDCYLYRYQRRYCWQLKNCGLGWWTKCWAHWRKKLAILGWVCDVLNQELRSWRALDRCRWAWGEGQVRTCSWSSSSVWHIGQEEQSLCDRWNNDFPVGVDFPNHLVMKRLRPNLDSFLAFW